MIPDDKFTLALAKAHLRVLHDDEDALITIMLDAAVARVEKATGRAFTERDMTLGVYHGEYMASIACGTPEGRRFYAELSPVLSYEASFVTAKTSDSFDGVTLRTLHNGASAFYFDWPASLAGDDADGSVWIKYKAGPKEPVPAAIVQAVLLLLADSYANREAGFVGTIYSVNPAVEQLLAPYRVDWTT
jgi:hypothetical protein